MEIKHHICFRNEEAAALIAYLLSNSVQFNYHKDLSSIDVYESSPHWPAIEKYMQQCQIYSPHVETIFSKAELQQAERLTVRSQWRNGNPQPENSYDYETITYTRDGYCQKCGCGLVQVDAFRLKNIPRWGQRHVFQLNWIEDELFISEVAKTAFEKSGISGIEFAAVKNKKGDQILPGVYQLKVSSLAAPGLVAEKTGLRQINKCSTCGATKYICNGRGSLAFPRTAFEGMPDIVKTSERFGDGQMASRKIIISQHVYQTICENHLDRGLVFAPIELISDDN